MWTLQTNKTEEGIVSATATHDSGFSWSAIIKVGDLSFANVAKEQLTKYEDEHKDDHIFEDALLAELNKEELDK